MGSSKLQPKNGVAELHTKTPFQFPGRRIRRMEWQRHLQCIRQFRGCCILDTSKVECPRLPAPVNSYARRPTHFFNLRPFRIETNSH